MQTEEFLHSSRPKFLDHRSENIKTLSSTTTWTGISPDSLMGNLSTGEFGDTVDGAVVAAAAALAPPPRVPPCEDLIDLTVNDLRCLHGDCTNIGHRQSFHSVPPPLLLPSPPTLRSIQHTKEQQYRLCDEEIHTPSQPYSRNYYQITDDNTPLNLSMNPRVSLFDIPNSGLIDTGVSRSKRLLQKVENFLDATLCLFAMPCDLCTAPQNIEEDAAEVKTAAAAAVLAKKVRNMVAVATQRRNEDLQVTESSPQKAEVGDALKMPFLLSEFFQSLPLAEPSFSPVLRHLLCLPEWKALAFLRNPTARGKELADQLATLAKNIARCKRKLRQVNIIQRRTAAAKQSEAQQTITSPPPPTSYTDPNTCPLSLLSLVLDREGAEPDPITQVTQLPPLNVDTETMVEPATVRPLSDVGPQTYTDTPPPPPLMWASSSSAMRNRSFSLPKHPTISSITCSPGQRTAKSPLDIATSSMGSVTCMWPPKRRRSEVTFVKGKSRYASGSCDLSVSSLPLHEHLTIRVKDTSDPHQSGFSAHHSVKTAASVSPSTSSLATVDTLSASSHHQPHQRSPLPLRVPTTMTSPSRCQDKVSLKYPKASQLSFHSAAHGEAYEGLESDILQRPPTPDLRRIDLDLSDLSNRLRILLIEDSHLRAGTLYLEDAPAADSITERDISHSRLCLICLDQLEKVESPPPSRLASASNGVINGGTTTSLFASNTKRRRLGEIRLEAWQVLQQAVLEVTPVSTRQLPPGTRVCAAWSDTLANNLYPGVISEFDADKSPPSSHCLCIDFDDGDHREVPLHRIRMLPDHFANLNELARASSTSTSGTSNITAVRPSQTSPYLSPNTPKVKNRVFTARRKRHVNGSASSSVELFPSVHNDLIKDRQADRVQVSRAVTWKPYGQLKKRHNGMPCYRSLKRTRDGLVVQLGDVVSFNSGKSGQTYLGAIKRINAPRHNQFSPLVRASWFYCPKEAGEDGKRIADHKGAVFLSDHADDNEANCIISRVRVAHNYAEYRLARRKKTLEMACSEDSKEANRQELSNEVELNSAPSISDGDSNPDEQSPTFFIAGKFDPLTGRVLAWDPDLSAELHLQMPSSTKPHFH